MALKRPRNEAFRSALERLDQTPETYGRLIGVTPRAVQLWLKGDRAIPMPVIILTRLLLSGKITVGQLHVMRPVAIKMKKKMDLPTGGNIWDRIYDNAKRVVRE